MITYKYQCNECEMVVGILEEYEDQTYNTPCPLNNKLDGYCVGCLERLDKH